MRRLISLITLLFFASLAISQSTEKPKEEWKTILENSSSIHQVETLTISKDGNGIFYYVHRVIIKNPKVNNGVKVTHILTLNAISCKAKMTALVADIFYSDETEIAKNIIAEKSTPGEPAEGTVQHIMMMRLCGFSKNYI